MRSRHVGVAVLVMSALVVGLSACGQQSETAAKPSIYALEVSEPTVDGDPKTLKLTEQAVRRLDITTVVINDRRRVPYGAVIYDKTGKPWVYTETAPQTFVRAPIVIDRIDEGVATVSSGPPVGTVVATASVIELYGAENGVGGGH